MLVSISPIYFQTQAQECIYEKLVLNEQSLGILSHLKIAKMAAKVNKGYFCFLT